MRKNITVSTVAEKTESGESKLLKSIEFADGEKVQIPINKDGSVKWFDDSQLLKKGCANHDR